MPDNITFEVRSNIDSLSATVLHGAFVSMVDEVSGASRDFLRADRLAHSRSGLTAAHVSSDKAHEIAGIIQARIGITPVTEKDARPTDGLYRHSQAPIFVDGGTSSPIFSPKGNEMWNRPEGIIGRRTVRGQRAQHFMAKTFAEAQLFLREDKQIDIALKAMDADAAVQKAAIEAE